MPATTASAAVEDGRVESTEGTARQMGAIWGALDEAARVAPRARAGWLLGLCVPTFAVQLEVANGLALRDELGHFTLFGGLDLQLVDTGGLLSAGGLVLSLIWIWIQAQAAAGLLVGLDQRNDVFGSERAIRSGDLWRAGSPVAGDCFWILATRLALLLAACVALLWIPGRALGGLLGVELLEAPATAVIVALLVLTLLYIVVLEVAAQLALVSCVANRRGPVSALQHAWRLLVSSPALAVRAAGAHFGLLIAVQVAVGALGRVLADPFHAIASLVVIALAGVAQACFWDRAYGLLGGWRSLPPLSVEARDRGKAPADRAGAVPQQGTATD